MGHNKKVHKHERKSLSLLQSDYNRITISCIISYILKSTQYKQFPKKKSRRRKQKTKEKEKKGWKEFMRKERKRESERWKKR